MKQKIIEFLKNKFNISLIVIQVLAIICYFLSMYLLCWILFFVLESAFLIVWGVKLIVDNKNAKYKMEIYNQLPYTDAERAQIKKTSENNAKNNKMMAVMLIFLGIILFFSGISVIF